MAEFTPITTQEEFDSILTARMSRQESKIRGEYKDLEEQSKKWAEEKQGYESTIEKHKADFDDLTKQLNDAKGKIANYESNELKTKVAIEEGLPIELRAYLKGSTEEEIKKSAQELGKFASERKTPPLADPEGDPPSGDNKINAYRGMLKKLHE